MVRKISLVMAVLAGMFAYGGDASSQTLAEQGWQPLPDIGKDTVYQYKPKTLGKTPEGFIGVWIRREQANDKMGIEPVAVTFDEFDCTNRKVRRSVGKIFQKGFDPRDIQPEPWTEVGKGSKEEALMRFACREGKKP